jgi:flavodoxin
MKSSIIAMAAAAAVFTGCSSKSSTAEKQDDNQSDKVLVLYYSQTGTTKTVAEELQKELGADIACIEAVNPYPNDYDATITRWRQELTDSILPEIKPLDVNLDEYSTIFLGFPVWGGTYALPVATFVSQNALKGKKVVTFATFGSGGIGSATADLKKALPEAEVVQGYGVRTARLGKAKDEISRFLIENGYVEGEVEPLPEYSEQAPVTDEEATIFNDACSGYKFPLGTPITVGKRKSPAGVDYKYTAKGQTPDGKEMIATIYVTVENGAKPEFTLVER